MSDVSTIVLQWKGPFEPDEEMLREEGNGLYLLTGKCPYEREDKIQYCGITGRSYFNRFKAHHKLEEITRERAVWLGKIIYPGDFDREHLKIAEKILIYFWQPPLNEKCTVTPPKPTCLISHWFKRDGTPRFNQLEIYRDLADVICWDGTYWRSGNLKVWQEE